MSTLRDFEHAGWEDPNVCSEYQDRLGTVVVQSIEPLLDAAGVRASDHVLDVATGAGVVAAAAATRGADVVGVDFSAEQLRRARVEHPDITFELAEADALPFDAATFDAVVSSFGVPHFPDPDAFFRESSRVLRPKGRLAFTVWAPPPQATGFEIIYAAVRRHGSLDVDLPTGPTFFLHAGAEESTKSLTAAGFESVKHTTVRQIWELQNADDLFESVLHGTVRTAALLRKQPTEVLGLIRDTVRHEVESFAAGGVYRVPMPAVVVSATKPVG